MLNLAVLRTGERARRSRPQTFSDNIQKRYQENPEDCRGDHAAENRGANGVSRGRSRALCNNQRAKPEDKSKTRHHDRTKSQLCCRYGGVVDVFAEPSLLDSKCDNQNAVFGRQSDERDKTDLRVNVEGISCNSYRDERAKNANAHRQKRGDGNIPALIESNEKQIGEQKREPKDN